MSKVQKSPARSPRTNYPKLDDKLDKRYDDYEEVKRENGNNDMDIESAISVSTEIKTPKKDFAEKMQSPETSKRKLEGGGADLDDEDEEFFGFELSPLKDFNKVKKLKENAPKTSASTNQGSNAVHHQQAVVPQKAVPNRPLPLSDPIYQEPFKYGWKRELVLRSSDYGGASHKSGEVYYISPGGKRMRTKNEIGNYLKGDLSLDCFIFSKERIGGPPDVDTVRSAVAKGNTARKSVIPPIIASPLFPDPNIDLGKRKPKPKLPKGASPDPPSNPPRKRTNRSPSTSSSAGSRTPQAKQNENDAPRSGKMARVKTATGLSACTIDCLLAMGTIPQLQCQQCLSLFHPDCVGVTKLQAALGNYICKTCSTEDLSTDQMNPTTPQLPMQKYAPTSSFNELSNPSMDAPMYSTPKNSVGMMGRKKVNDAPPPLPPVPAPIPVFNDETPPQTIATIDGRKYIVVMKKKDPTQKISNKKTIQQMASPPAQLVDDSKKLPSRTRLSPRSSPSHTSTVATANNNKPLETAAKSPSVAITNNKSTSSLSPKSVRKPIPIANKSASPSATAPAIAVASTSSVLSTFPQQPRFATNFFSNVSIGYDVLLNTFQYLKVQELLRASCVCRMWNQVANHSLLWKTVRMKNSQVNDWSGLANTLKKNSTHHLDLRKMLSTGSDEMWQQFTENIGRVDNLESIDLCRCSTSIVEGLFESNPNIKCINALALRDDTINLEHVSNLKQLQELRLRSNDGLNLESDLTPLAGLTNLKHLSLTFVNKLNEKSIRALKGLVNLESLELGECNDFPTEFATEVLPRLTKLERLRLEKGQQDCCTFEILGAVAQLPNLVQLELINFDIKLEFDEHVAKCTNLRKILLIPTYVSQSAATNNMVLKGVISLSASLTTFVWAVTQELLKVTELYVDQCDDKKDKKPPPPGESIPILKPVPSHEDSHRTNDNTPSDIPAQVEIVPLSTVENILHKAMPDTKIKIMKIPFVNTWRQTMIDLQ